jgi:hypothetical protein
VEEGCYCLERSRSRVLKVERVRRIGIGRFGEPWELIDGESDHGDEQRD